MRGGPANRRGLRPHSSQGLTFPFTPFSANNGADWFPGGEFTLEARVYIESYDNPPGYSGSNEMQTLLLGNQSGAYRFMWAIKNRKLRLFSYANGQEYLAGPDLPVKQWLGLATAVKLGSGNTLVAQHYVNGAPVGAPFTFSALFAPVRVVAVGHIDSARLNYAFYGRLDSVRCWSVARGSQDIAATWRLRNGNVEGITNGTMAACYELEESPLANNSPMLADGSGNGRHMTSSTNTWEGSTSVVVPEVL